MMKRRPVLAKLFAAAILGTVSASGFGTTFPEKPVHMLVGFSAGSGTDLVARRLAEGLSAELARPVIVENISGAGSTLAAGRAAKAQPDGYTIYLADFSHAIAPGLYRSLPYDAVKGFTGVAPVSRFPMSLVASAKSGHTSVAELVAAARRAPGSLSFGSSGNGSALHLLGEVFAERIGAKLLHVPYRGGGDVLNALVAGDIDFAFFPSPPLVAFAQAEKVRVLGVPGAKRDPRFPAAPTLEEQGIANLDASTWNVLLAPRGTPSTVLERLAGAVNRVTRSASFVQGVATLGAMPLPVMSPEQTLEFVADEVRRWVPVVQAAGAKPQ